MQIQRGRGRMVRMQKTVSDQVVEMLAAAGVRRIYGMAGDALHPLMEALQRDSRIRWVHVRHEETAAFAASAMRSVQPYRPHKGIRSVFRS